MEAFSWWTDEHKQLAQNIKQLVDDLMPRAEEAAWKQEFPWDLVKAFSDAGYFGVGINQRYGGMGLGMTGTVIVSEELGRIPGGFGSGVYAASMFGGVHQVTEYGSNEQRERFLPRVARGELGAIALTEPSVGTDAAGIETTAVREGDRYIFNGKKRFVTGVGVADRYLLYARTSHDPEAIRHNRHLSAFILEKGTPGFSIEKINELIGLDNMHNGYLDLNDTPVPLTNRIGEEGQGWQMMMSGLNFERIICAALSVGIFRELLNGVVSYGQRRLQFGQPTIDMPINQFKIADILMDLKLARLATYHAASLTDAGEPTAADASICKLFASERVMQSALEAVQVMGGDGVTRFYPLERLLRDAKITQIAGGTSEAMKLLIYRQGLREYDDGIAMPLREINQELGIPVVSSDPVRQTEIDEDLLLRVLAEDYRVNPGLYMSLDDLQKHFDVDVEKIKQTLISLEDKNLVNLYKKRGNIKLAKATYGGLKQANPTEYYRWFPSRVNEDDIF
jgi:alkylation response protein AidB-like acyl-CoA dehydrogenase